MLVSTQEFKKGLKILYDGEPYMIVEFQHVKPGKGGAFVRTRIKSLVTGNVLDVTFRSGEKVELLELEEKRMQFLYREGTRYYFMDQNTFDQLFIEEEYLGDARYFLTEGLVINVSFFRGNPIGVELPNFVDLKVVKTEPGLRGDTAQSPTKPATLETGYTLQVPLFVNEGDIVKIDTRTGEYIERVMK